MPNGLSSSDGPVATLLKFWPLVLVLGLGLLAWSRNDTILTNLERRQTSAEAVNSQQDQRLAIMERDSRVFEERVSGMANQVAQTRAYLEQMREAVRDEHKEILDAVRPRIGGPH